MAVGRRTVLAIEIAPSQLRALYGAIVGQRLKVYDFASEEILIADPENTARQLEALVARKRLRSSPSALVLSGPGVVHRLLDFPVMPLNELVLVVQREMRTIGGAAARDVVCDWEVIEETSEPANLKQVRVLAAMAPRAQVDGAWQLLTRCGLKPALLTTAPIALLRSLRFVQDEEKGLRAILYVEGVQGYLLGVQNGAWSFCREFSSTQAEEGVDGLLREALKEANRVLLYHRQRYREEREMRFLLGGGKGLAELGGRLETEIGIQGQLARPGPALDLTPLEERANIFRDLFPAFMVPLGLVAAACAPAGINLLPDAARKSGRVFPMGLSFARGGPAAAALLLLVFLGLHLFLVREERRYQSLLQDRAALHSSWVPAIQAAEGSRSLRESEAMLAQTMGTSRIGEPRWIALFKTLSRLAHPDLILQSVSVQRDQGQWIITLKGEVISPDGYAAQAAFTRFYQGLKTSPYLEEVELFPVNVTTVKSTIEGPARKIAEETVPVEVKKTKIEFELRGQARES